MSGARFSQIPVKLIIDFSNIALPSHGTFPLMNRIFKVTHTSNFINNITINQNHYETCSSPQGGIKTNPK